MALEAPAHGHRLVLPHLSHLVDRAVARAAADAVVDVDAVIEVDVVGELMNAVPLDRRVVLPAVKHRLQLRSVDTQLRVAGHARLGGRYRGCVGRLDGRMAVTAVEA